MQPKTYIIAEAGVNHNGSLDMALRLVDEAVKAGVDAVKFQTFKPEDLVNKQAEKADYQKQTTQASESQLEMLKKLVLDEKAHETLIKHCQDQHIEFLSTAFDFDSLDLLVHRFQLPFLKVASGEITNAPMLLKMAQTQKPIILSTGMATLGEIEQALAILAFGYIKNNEKPSLTAFEHAYYSETGQTALQQNITLLHCTTEYPTPFNEVNLNAITTLRQAFNLPVGLSDHTQGINIPIAAIACGAVLIEKHFTLDKNLSGPDHKASLEPDELQAMVTGIRQVEMALGHGQKIPMKSELKNRLPARKSLIAAKNIKKGMKFTEDNLTVKRPATGQSPLHYWEMLGQIATKDYNADDII